MSEATDKKALMKAVVKDIIIKLHQGATVEESKTRFEQEIGAITSSEIAEIEQSLINDGVSPDEIKKFCNVHALLFETALKKAAADTASPSHPVYLFKLENREIEKLTASLRDIIKNQNQLNDHKFRQTVRKLLEKLRGVDVHHTRKEQLLFPFLERYGFMGPSKVMWGKDNEIRGLLKDAFTKIDAMPVDEYIKTCLNPLVEEIDGMIFKEENILFPASLEKLSVQDWVEILKESSEVGYVYIEPTGDTEHLIAEFKKTVAEEPKIIEDNVISLPTGNLTLAELLNVLNSLPMDVTFVDKNDRVRYFTDNKERIFVRTKSVIGREVRNCHPPQSQDKVEQILASFKSGARSYADFWINFKDKLVYIKFIAVRDKTGQYLGTLEVTQDVDGIRKLQGEKRLLDDSAAVEAYRLQPTITRSIKSTASNNSLRSNCRSKELDLTQSICALTESYPELIPLLKEIGFLGIANPVTRNTLGRIITLPEGCKKQGKNLDEVLTILKGKGFEIKQ